MSLKPGSAQLMEDLLLKLQLNLLGAVANPGSTNVTETAGGETLAGKTSEQWFAVGVEVGGKLLAALVIFVIGRWIARILGNSLRRFLTSRKVDPILVSFVSNFTYTMLLVFVILAAITKLGVQTTSFIAVIGAAGLAIGLALQGSLANFASGILLIIFRPFRVGDYVEGGGTAGTVEELSIFTTILKSPDNKLIIVPNSSMTSGNIINFSAKESRRIDMVFGISYGDDIDKARQVMAGVLENDPMVLKDPPYTVAVSELGDSSVNLVCRPWVKTADYWAAKFAITEAVKKGFDAADVTIPFPQRDVHLYKHDA